MGLLSLLGVTVFEAIELFTGGSLLAVTLYTAGRSGKSSGGGARKRSYRRSNNHPSTKIDAD